MTTLTVTARRRLHDPLLQLHREFDHSAAECSIDHQSGMGEEIEHPVVLGKCLGQEPRDAHCCGRVCKLSEEQRGDAESLVVVVRDEGDFCVGVTQSVVPPDRHDVGVRDSYECLSIEMIHGGEVRDLVDTEVRVDSEEPRSLTLW